LHVVKRGRDKHSSDSNGWGMEREIFLSYAREDTNAVQPLIAALEGEGQRVWWDRHLQGGQEWEQILKAKLMEVDCVIVAWSPWSVDSNYICILEAGVAMDRNILVPVLIAPCALPQPYDEIQTIDLSNWRGKRNHRAFRQLLEAIQACYEAVHLTERMNAARHNLAPVFENANMRAITDAAQRGDATAQNILGYAFKLGTGGFVVNDNEAIRWFTLSAQAGNVDSMGQLGGMYSNMNPPDWPKCAAWLERAARAGDAHSAYQAHLIHSGGFPGVGKNLILARQYLELAARLGDDDARRQLVSGR
jgi:hypothetical protein